jgi:hypothetical protein
MSGRATTRPGTDAPRVGDHWAWAIGLPLLVAVQGWLTLGLFGARSDLSVLVDDRPLISGRHPLHLYHGYLGAGTLLRRGNLTCYDPYFHAGYPKTPVFDSGSRPAELVLALTGGQLRPGAYKLTVVAVCIGVPLLLWVAARGAGATRAGAMLAASLGLLIWWGGPCREDLEAGAIDLLLAALLAVVQAGLLIRLHRQPGPFPLLLVVVTGFLGWFAHPLFMAVLLPAFFFYYLGAGVRHTFVWHATLFGGLILSIGANAFWLFDWVRYWWIRGPLSLDMPLVAHRTIRYVWEAPLWGTSADRSIAIGIVVAALIGLFLWRKRGQPSTARLFGFAASGLLLLTVAGIVWVPAGKLGAAQLIVPALLFASLPAAHAVSEILAQLRRVSGPALGSAAVVLACVAGAAWPTSASWLAHANGSPLQIGLSPEQLTLVDRLKQTTTADARILWEDRRGGRCASRWTALLPVLTGRSFLGGLDADAGIDHASTALVDEALAGRPLPDWSDDELRTYCTRYNVGWIVCWTPAAEQRFRAWPDAELIAEVHDGETGRLFVVRRPHSFALVGSATWVRADTRRIILEDVKPDHGEVVLSLHYQTGLRVLPARVGIFRASDGASDPNDCIRFVRLKMEEPVARITIVWDR